MKKLSPFIVEGVRVDKEAGMRQCDIAVKYGISAGSVSRILRGSRHKVKAANVNVLRWFLRRSCWGAFPRQGRFTS